MLRTSARERLLEEGVSDERLGEAEAELVYAWPAFSMYPY